MTHEIHPMLAEIRGAELRQEADHRRAVRAARAASHAGSAAPSAPLRPRLHWPQMRRRPAAPLR